MENSDKVALVAGTTTSAAIGGPAVAGGIVVVGAGAIVYGGFKLLGKWVK